MAQALGISDQAFSPREATEASAGRRATPMVRRVDTQQVTGQPRAATEHPAMCRTAEVLGHPRPLLKVELLATVATPAGMTCTSKASRPLPRAAMAEATAASMRVEAGTSKEETGTWDETVAAMAAEDMMAEGEATEEPIEGPIGVTEGGEISIDRAVAETEVGETEVAAAGIMIEEAGTTTGEIEVAATMTGQPTEETAEKATTSERAMAWRPESKAS